jgi:hypothetical protein
MGMNGNDDDDDEVVELEAVLWCDDAGRGPAGMLVAVAEPSGEADGYEVESRSVLGRAMW